MSNGVPEGASEDRPGFAVLFMFLGIALLSFQDALVKLVASETSLWQFQTIRAVFNLSVIALVAGRTGGLRTLVPQDAIAVALRSALIVATMLAFFAGAPFLTLPEMGAGLYTYPVFVTVLAALFLGEKVGKTRIAAIALALIGALLILKPFAMSFRPVQLLPVLAGLCYAGNVLLLRSRCRCERPLTLAAGAAADFLLAGLAGTVALGVIQPSSAEWPYILRAWPALAAITIGVAAICSLTNVVGNVFMIKAYQSAEASWLAPFDYSYLLLTVLWGALFFREMPDGLSLAGMAAIALAGIITLRRQRLHRRLPGSPGNVM